MYTYIHPHSCALRHMGVNMCKSILWRCRSVAACLTACCRNDKDLSSMQHANVHMCMENILTYLGHVCRAICRISKCV